YAASSPPLLGGSVVEAVAAVAAILDATQRHDPAVARSWVRDTQGVEQGVETVAGVYRDVVAARR
ncbi:MAG: hypothetical protein ACRDRL_07390, partial [Sciscionella sp.]